MDEQGMISNICKKPVDLPSESLQETGQIEMKETLGLESQTFAAAVYISLCGHQEDGLFDRDSVYQNPPH
jgi:hypothetical protein